jgi:hypothetical protein
MKNNIKNKFNKNKKDKKDKTGIAIKHRTCKLSIITGNNGIPLGVTLTSTLVHDVKLILNTLLKNILFNKLCGNKGYIANDNFKNDLKTTYNIELITPYRKYKNKAKNKENILEENILEENILEFFYYNQNNQNNQNKLTKIESLYI